MTKDLLCELMLDYLNRYGSYNIEVISVEYLDFNNSYDIKIVYQPDLLSYLYLAYLRTWVLPIFGIDAGTRVFVGWQSPSPTKFFYHG